MDFQWFALPARKKGARKNKGARKKIKTKEEGAPRLFKWKPRRQK